MTEDWPANGTLLIVGEASFPEIISSSSVPLPLTLVTFTSNVVPEPVTEWMVPVAVPVKVKSPVEGRVVKAVAKVTV